MRGYGWRVRGEEESRECLLESSLAGIARHIATAFVRSLHWPHMCQVAVETECSAECDNVQHKEHCGPGKVAAITHTAWQRHISPIAA